MARKRHLLVVERLEPRQLLTAVPWFEDSGQALGSDHTALELGDLDGDGDLDAFFGCWGHSDLPSDCSETQVWLNNGSGQFSKGWSDSARTGAVVALGDLDNDGDLDAFFTMATPSCEPGEVWLNDGQGNFEDSGQRFNGCDIDVGLGDVDGDGDLDAVTAGVVTPSKVWLNDGAGQFTDSRQRLAADGWSYAVDLGDVDGDRDLDAWFGRGSDSPNHSDRVYFNDGKGNFTDSGQSLNSISTGDVALGDLDADGDLDAYLVNSTWYGAKYPHRVWMNDGTGKFTDSGQRLGRSNGRWVGLGDLDGDGDLDAIVANGASLGTVRGEPNAIWLNDGAGVFTLAQELGNAATTAVALGDIDNDGDLDALFANLGQDNQVWFNTQLDAGDANRDGVFNQLDIVQVLQSAKYQTGQPATWAEGDFNRDGVFDQLDIVAALQTGKYGQA